MKKRYNDLNTYLRSVFGCRVQKISVDAGLGCPNRDGTLSTKGCIFCNARGSGTGAFSRGISITEQLRIGKLKLSKRYKAKKFIAYFQSFSNTYAPPDKLRRLYDEALAVDGIAGLAIGTRPDCVDQYVLDLLQQYTETHLVWLEYGLQSVHSNTLDRINRGHDFNSFKRAVEAGKQRGIQNCAHVILGLPGENREDMLETARILGRMGIDSIKIHLLYVVKDTELHRMYEKGEYVCLDQRQYTDLVCDFLELIPETMVIQRITGDPHPDELIAPDWALNKLETIEIITKTLEQRDSRQGIFSSVQ